jgi:hypothetical protein
MIFERDDGLIRALLPFPSGDVRRPGTRVQAIEPTLAEIFRRWFGETLELRDGRKSIDKSLQQPWHEAVLIPLINAPRVDTDEVSELKAA